MAHATMKVAFDDASAALIRELTEAGRLTAYPWLTIDQACAYMQISRSMLNKIVHSGELRSTTVGTSPRIHRDWCDAYLRNRAMGGPPDAA